MSFRLIFAIISCLALTCCTDSRHDSRLIDIKATVSDNPEDALLRLGGICRDSLSEPDRHLHDFLSIKANDKAYITHTSDSLILDVIDWYSGHESDDYYPEALYYGGRVYSDLGDSPTALKYFQQSLDLLPEDTNNQRLRCKVLSQTGRLLTSLSLYHEAIPFIKDALAIDKALNDTLNTIHDIQLLAGTYLRAGKYKDAVRHYKESYNISLPKYPALATKTRLYSAASEYKIGHIDSALNIIRGIPEKINPLIKNTALAYAAEIYLEAGIPDSAYIYAHELVSNDDPHNKEIGFQVLLTPELRQYIPADSLDLYILEYVDLIRTLYDNNENQMSINQQSIYNYQIHERERQKAEKNKALWKNMGISVIFLCILLIITVMYLKIRNQRNIINLHQALESIDMLKKQLENTGIFHENRDNIIDNDKNILGHNPNNGNNTEVLRDILRNELLALYDCSERQPVSSVILESETYKKVQALINDNRTIKDNDPIWEEIETVVLQCSPDFVTNLHILTLGNLTTIDLHTALLVKCGIKPVHMATLMAKSNGAIVSRRENLGIKVLDNKMGVKVIDGIIRLM